MRNRKFKSLNTLKWCFRKVERATSKTLPEGSDLLHCEIFLRQVVGEEHVQHCETMNSDSHSMNQKILPVD